MTHLVNKSYVFRIYPTKEQEELINKTFGCCRYVYNYFLAKSIEDYKTTGRSNSCYDNIKELTQLKKELVWLKEADSSSLQQSIRNLDFAYQSFFRRVKEGTVPGFPRFKKKSSEQSYKTVNCNRIPKQGSQKLVSKKVDVSGLWNSSRPRRQRSSKHSERRS